MENFEPEFGQRFFGNEWKQFDVDENIGNALYNLSEKLMKLMGNNFDMPSYGVEYSNDVFSMTSYYWGECTCGFEDADIEWDHTHHHKKDCFNTKVKAYEESLEKQGISLFGDNDEQYIALVDKFAKENGYTGWEGSGSYCNCGYDDEYRKWRETHNHKEDCPIVRPNFLYKPTGLIINWYKYIGRGMSSNMECNIDDFKKTMKHCLSSAKADKKKIAKNKK